MKIPSIFESYAYLLPNSILNYYQTDSKSRNVNQYKSNYYKKLFISRAIGSLCYILSGASIVLFKKGASNLSIVATAISAISLGILWNIKGNQPSLLAEKVAEFLFKKDEDKALEYIKKGAELNECSGGELFQFDALPLIPIRIYKIPFCNNILTYAIRNDCSQVVDYLLSLKVYSKDQLTSELMHTRHVRIGQKLIDAGASVSYSNLNIQLILLNRNYQKATCEPDIIDVLEMICLLLNTGVKLPPYPEGFSKDKVINLLNNIANKNHKNAQINQLVTTIQNKI